MRGRARQETHNVLFASLSWFAASPCNSPYFRPSMRREGWEGTYTKLHLEDGCLVRGRVHDKEPDRVCLAQSPWRFGVGSRNRTSRRTVAIRRVPSSRDGPQPCFPSSRRATRRDEAPGHQQQLLRGDLWGAAQAQQTATMLTLVGTLCTGGTYVPAWEPCHTPTKLMLSSLANHRTRKDHTENC